MSYSFCRLAPSLQFWTETVSALFSQHSVFLQCKKQQKFDFSACRVIVPAFSHAQLFLQSMEEYLQKNFIPPQMNTMSGWLALQPTVDQSVGYSERLMQLYAVLREHAWLKQLFATEQNVDLLPLTETLLSLSDELTQTLLPVVQAKPDEVSERWDKALASLTPSAQQLLSEEAQLVWTLWQAQLEEGDPLVQRFAAMMRLAQAAYQPLIWISPVEPDPIEAAFLQLYSQRFPVFCISINWQNTAIPPLYRRTWPEIMAVTETDATEISHESHPDIPMAHLQLCPGKDLDDVSVKSAQAVLQWLQQGKQSIGVIAQDRVMARRFRALLERADVFVADETGWMLSTTRAASVLSSWFQLVMTRAKTQTLFDFLKLPFLQCDGKEMITMRLETRLRRKNIQGEWQAIFSVLDKASEETLFLQRLYQEAKQFTGTSTLLDWAGKTLHMLQSLGIYDDLIQDEAGLQVVQLIQTMQQEITSVTHTFQLSEWWALLNLQLDSTSFVPTAKDRRVTMLPLNGARLRPFDAMIVLGTDADNFPSKAKETLFFSDSVRHELGLVTRHQRQQQQLRDVVELLCTHQDVVFSWQTNKRGEQNPVSPWIARLQLHLKKSQLPDLPVVQTDLPKEALVQQTVTMPLPRAGVLTPDSLSSSALNVLLACPYQYFAKYMLKIVVMDELSDTAEKRDYGTWLHAILEKYHETVRDQSTPFEAREALLSQISQQEFEHQITQYPGVLGFYSRWQKVIPAYISWANEREKTGWHFVSGETKAGCDLPLKRSQLGLYGRLDRIDQHDNGNIAVLDYKTKKVEDLVAKVKEPEDFQLAFYGLISKQPLSSAHYVALEKNKKEMVGDVSLSDEALVMKQDELTTLITVTMQSVQDNAPMPANGIERVCQYCDVRGMCRKGGWQ